MQDKLTVILRDCVKNWLEPMIPCLHKPRRRSQWTKHAPSELQIRLNCCFSALFLPLPLTWRNFSLSCVSENTDILFISPTSRRQTGSWTLPCNCWISWESMRWRDISISAATFLCEEGIPKRRLRLKSSTQRKPTINRKHRMKPCWTVAKHSM